MSLSYATQLKERQRNQALKYKIEKFLESLSLVSATTSKDQLNLPHQECGEEELWVHILSFIPNDNEGFYGLLRMKAVSKLFYRWIEYRPEIWNNRSLTLGGNFIKYGLGTNILLAIKNYCDMYRVKGYNLKNLVFKDIDFSGLPSLTSFIAQSRRFVHGITFDNCSSIDLSFDQYNENGDVQFIQCSFNEGSNKQNNPIFSRDYWQESPVVVYQPKYQEGLPFSHVRRIVLDCGEANVQLFEALSISWPEGGFHLVIKGDVKNFLDRAAQTSRGIRQKIRFLTIYPQEALRGPKRVEFYLQQITTVFSSVEIIYLGDSDKPLFMNTNSEVKNMNRGFIFTTENDYSKYEEVKKRKWELVNSLEAARCQLSPETQRSVNRMILEEKRLLQTTQSLGAFSIDRLNRTNSWNDEDVQVKTDYNLRARNGSANSFDTQHLMNRLNQSNPSIESIVQVQAHNDLVARNGRTIYFNAMRQIVQEHSDLMKEFPERRPLDYSNLLRRIDQLAGRTNWSHEEDECRRLQEDNEQMRMKRQLKMESEIFVAGYR